MYSVELIDITLIIKDVIEGNELRVELADATV